MAARGEVNDHTRCGVRCSLLIGSSECIPQINEGLQLRPVSVCVRCTVIVGDVSYVDVKDETISSRGLRQALPCLVLEYREEVA